MLLNNNTPTPQNLILQHIQKLNPKTTAKQVQGMLHGSGAFKRVGPLLWVAEDVVIDEFQKPTVRPVLGKRQ